MSVFAIMFETVVALETGLTTLSGPSPPEGGPPEMAAIPRPPMPGLGMSGEAKVVLQKENRAPKQIVVLMFANMVYRV